MNQLDDIEVMATDSKAVVITGDIQAALVADLQPVAERMASYTQTAATIRVTTAAEAQAAVQVMGNIDADLKTVKGHEVLTKITEGLFKLHRKATAFRALFTDPMTRDRKAINAAVVAYQQDQQRKAAELQAKLQAEANAKARREQEALEKKAASMKTVEKQEQYRQQAAEIIPPTIVIPTEKFARTSKRWVVKSIDRQAFLTAAATDQNLQGYIEISETALARSKAANSMLQVTGVEFIQVEK